MSGTQVTPLLQLDEIDNGIVDLLMDELRPLGLISDQETFERLFVEVVQAAGPDEDLCWSEFYRNTLRRLDCRAGEGSLAVFSRIYNRASRLAGEGSILDLGSGFGFFALARSASTPSLVVGCDASGAAVSMSSKAAGRLSSRAVFVTGDALHLPFPSGSFDSVCALHVLEHLPQLRSRAMLSEATRVARRRVVLAVPMEPEPEAVFGHRQRFSLASLNRLGQAVRVSDGEWDFEVSEADGGWLVLNRHGEPRG